MRVDPQENQIKYKIKRLPLKRISGQHCDEYIGVYIVNIYIYIQTV